MQASTVIVAANGDKVVASIAGNSVSIKTRRGRQVTGASYALSRAEYAQALYEFVVSSAEANLLSIH